MANKTEHLIMKVREILNGIDLTETDDPDGWWETSVGADFGAEKLRQIEAALREAGHE